MESPQNTIWIINPDILAKRISEHEQLPLPQANLLAVQRIESWLYSSVAAYQTIGVETVLSSGKYRKLVETAKANGFQINLIYVYLRTVDLNIERVHLRVKRGGHDVPEDKIRERRTRSFEQLSWFFKEADNAYICDNSSAGPVLMISKENGDEFSVNVDTLPDIAKAVTIAHAELSDIFEAQSKI
ncbi:hypothetical protein ABAC460_19760 [Asticcacaulis sp. AC460]|nr:hypothetical protein ABAC460_19760 [Asticcacaulis sp. AC460]